MHAQARPTAANSLAINHTGVATVSYIDSVEIQQNSYFKADFLRFMQANCGGAYGPTRVNPTPELGFNSLWLHQPSREAIEYLADKPCRIVRVHIALDLLPATRRTAKELQEYLARTLLLDSRSTEPVTWFVGEKQGSSTGATTYFKFSTRHTAGKTATLYSDRVSKVTGQPCCHLELRIVRDRTLRSIGLESGLDLLHLDHKRFWNRHLVLAQPPSAEELGKVWEKEFRNGISKTSKRFPYGGRTEAIRRVGNLLLRTSLDRNGETNANDLLHYLKLHRQLGARAAGRLFRRLDSSWLLPMSANAMWHGNEHESESNQSLRSGMASISLLSCPIREAEVPY